MLTSGAPPSSVRLLEGKDTVEVGPAGVNPAEISHLMEGERERERGHSLRGRT